MKKLIFVVFLFSVLTANSQNKTELPKTISIFIDCEFCDFDFLRTEMKFINYSREPKEADLHVLVTNQNTASGGDFYTLFFIGQKSFQNINDTLTFTNLTDDSHEIRRERLLNKLKLGLIKYVSKTQVAEKISISFDEEVHSEQIQLDKWKNWVFRLSTSGWGQGDKNFNTFNINSYVSADKITEKFKSETYFSNNYQESSFDYEDYSYLSINRSYYANTRMVFSLNDNWSAGFTANGRSSTYSNLKFQTSIRPAIEYNIFPYKLATRKQLRINYSVGPTQSYYFNETIYDKTEEFLFRQNLGVAAEVVQKWGRLSSSISYNSYLHDLSLNSINYWGSINVRIAKGLEFYTSMGFNIIHDQLSLVKGDATQEEILLQRKELQTNYSYWGNIGITYTFGNLYNNIVNPRFGN